MKRLSGLLFGLALFGLLQAPVFGQTRKEEPSGLPKIVVQHLQPGPSYKHLDGQLLVFVVNGVGGSTTLSDNLLEINGEEHLHMRLAMIPWTRTLSKIEDLVDSEAQLKAAARIACSVAAIRKDAPHAHIYFIGHSAGARVILAAAEMSAPKSIDRIFVLSAAVSQCYDLTGALKAARYGIDNFYCTNDWVLDPDNEHYKNADGQPGHAAGKFGFRMVSCDKADIELYRNLRQHPWTEELHGGGHMSWTMEHNLRKAVVPMFFTAPVLAPPIERPKMAPAK